MKLPSFFGQLIPQRQALWNSFNGQPADFPGSQSISGLPIIFEVQLRNGSTKRARVSLLADPPRFHDESTGAVIPTDQITHWRWSRESFKRINT